MAPDGCPIGRCWASLRTQKSREVGGILRRLACGPLSAASGVRTRRRVRSFFSTSAIGMDPQFSKQYTGQLTLQ